MPGVFGDHVHGSDTLDHVRRFASMKCRSIVTILALLGLAAAAGTGHAASTWQSNPTDQG